MTTAREDSVRLADLLRREHHALAEFLIALSGFDRERRWVELGHSSLFYFLHRDLGLSKGAAYYRKTAAELVQRFPEVLEALREGKLCLTSIVELSKVLTDDNRAEVLPRFFHVSKREAKEVTAELLPTPAPALRTVVTALRAEVAGASRPLGPPSESATASPDALAERLVHPANLGHASSRVPDVACATEAPASEVADARKTTIVPLTAKLSRLHLTVSRPLLEKLARARDALSHSHPDASDDEILEVGLDLIIQRYEKRRGIGAKPRKPSSNPADAGKRTAAAAATPPPATGRSRHVSAAVWRAVWERDGGQCVWPVEGGGICGATRALQLDHVDGFALGAEATVERCRLLCAWHNDVHARNLFGVDLMNRYTRPKGPRCSEPAAPYGVAPGQPPSRSSRVASCGSAPAKRRPSPPAAARRELRTATLPPAACTGRTASRTPRAPPRPCR